MANQTIPNLTAATSLNGTEELYAVQSGADVRITTEQIVSLATGGGGSMPLSISAGGTGATTVTGAQANLIGGAGYPYANGVSGLTYSPTVPTTALSGVLQAAQEPAHSGDMTNAAGSLVTAVGHVNGVAYGSSPNTNTVPVVTGSNTVTYEAVPNSALANYTISGIALGSNLDTLTFGTHLAAGGSSYNGSAGVTISTDAASLNTASTLVARDASGNFAAGTITAALSGNASTATTASAAPISGITGLGTNVEAALTNTLNATSGLVGYGGSMGNVTGHASLDLPLSGGTLTGELITKASASGGSGFNLPAGVAPSAPANGDLWTTSGGVYAQIGGATLGPLVGGPSSSTSGDIPTFNGTSGTLLQDSGVLLSTVLVSANAFYKTSVTSVAFTVTGAGTISVNAGTIVECAGVLTTYATATAVTMPSLSAGTDYAIYQCSDGTIRADANFSAPTGYTTANSRQIGGFHYAPGGNATAMAGGNTTPAINPYSVWDLKFRPRCVDPRGMALVAGWIAIVRSKLKIREQQKTINGLTHRVWILEQHGAMPVVAPKAEVHVMAAPPPVVVPPETVVAAPPVNVTEVEPHVLAPFLAVMVGVAAVSSP